MLIVVVPAMASKINVALRNVSNWSSSRFTLSIIADVVASEKMNGRGRARASSRMGERIL